MAQHTESMEQDTDFGTGGYGYFAHGAHFCACCGSRILDAPEECNQEPELQLETVDRVRGRAARDGADEQVLGCTGDIHDVVDERSVTVAQNACWTDGSVCRGKLGKGNLGRRPIWESRSR